MTQTETYIRYIATKNIDLLMSILQKYKVVYQTDLPIEVFSDFVPTIMDRLNYNISVPVRKSIESQLQFIMDNKTYQNQISTSTPSKISKIVSDYITVLGNLVSELADMQIIMNQATEDINFPKYNFYEEKYKFTQSKYSTILKSFMQVCIEQKINYDAVVKIHQLPNTI